VELNNGPLSAGIELLVGSRLLDEEALTGNLIALKIAMKAATPSGSVSNAYLVAGKGVRNVVPRDGVMLCCRLGGRLLCILRMV